MERCSKCCCPLNIMNSKLMFLSQTCFFLLNKKMSKPVWNILDNNGKWRILFSVHCLPMTYSLYASLYAVNVDVNWNLNAGHHRQSLPKQSVMSSSCVTSLVSSRKTTLLLSHFMSVPAGTLPVSSQPCMLCITDHYQGASLNSPARLFRRACELGRGKSNTAWYLFNESDLLSCLYLRADCLSALLSSFVTLLEKKECRSAASVFVSICLSAWCDGPSHRCAKVILADLSSSSPSPVFFYFFFDMTSSG